ncbi:MAG: Bifunctional chorismate mutase/prephenate dehydratase [Thermocaproicibacter melissae]|jgi:chorismate mutase / prephenate dehydratase|uniref:bifunctional chorismate mutase/prephenate dehydratase n=1 Tax=Thermocaproicibacter melissae TaxID=2966552 RepID=UPI003A0FC142
MTLEEIRSEIDEIDAQLLPLFLRRMKCAEKVAEIKKGTGRAVFDPVREKKILDDVAAKAGSYGGEARIVYSTMMTMSRAAQHRILGAGKELRDAVERASSVLPSPKAVACLGQSGSFSHEAMLRLYPNAKPLLLDDFSAVFEAVADGSASLGIVPVENSSAGSVGEVYDLILKYRFSILGALSLPIRHCLASAETDIHKIHTVYSHPQALRQCTGFLRAHGWETKPCSSTAAAAEEAEKPGVAAVCSLCAAKERGLNILAEDIQDVSGNRTRFLVIGREIVIPADADKISLCFSLPHTIGSLSGVLTRFAAAGLNLTKIESRPIPGKNFEYDFYLDFTGSAREERTLGLLCALHDELPRFTFLGNYHEIE